LWTCEAVSFAANEANQYDCLAPTSPEHDASYTRGCTANDACMDAARMNGRNEPTANAPT